MLRLFVTLQATRMVSRRRKPVETPSRWCWLLFWFRADDGTPGPRMGWAETVKTGDAGTQATLEGDLDSEQFTGVRGFGKTDGQADGH